ncbi:hypothetical protein KI387_025716, partial [Taxus chinensis]
MEEENLVHRIVMLEIIMDRVLGNQRELSYQQRTSTVKKNSIDSMVQALDEKFGIEKSHDEEYMGEREEETPIDKGKVKSSHDPFKVKTKVETKSFKGQVDAESLDKWLRKLE